MSTTIGLDVGGAHLKIAVLQDNRVEQATQCLCPLWQGLDKLDTALEDARPLTENATAIAITMTGELSDLFQNRKQGVDTLVDKLTNHFQGKERYWISGRGFGDAKDAKLHHQAVGSTNFVATATAAAQFAPNAVLIDMGSTTTDIVPIVGGKPTPKGLTDATRQQTGELVYTGLTRTAVMAVANRVPFNGTWQTLAREYLATMADIYRLMGTLPDCVDLHATADGQGKSLEESLIRFARMLGRDTHDTDHTVTGTDPWKASVAYIAAKQLRSIEDGLFQVLTAHPKLHNPTVVTAGIGAHIGEEIARRLALVPIRFGKLINAPTNIENAATQNAPATAVALLYAASTRR